MNFTKWFKLRKPEQEEFYDVDDFNFNADILDTELKNVKDNYLPLAGGTVTGDVAINGALTVPNGLIRTNDTSKAITIMCTTDKKSGANLVLGGKDATNNAGEFVITATNGTNSFNFWGLPSGKLSWGNKNIVRSVNSVNADDNGNVSITTVNHAISADSATSATCASQNASGHLLADTIVKNIAISGKTITVTKLDNTKYTLTTQDTNTTYSKLSQLQNDCGYITSNNRAYPRKVDGCDINFNWSGMGGQPTWLWGGEDGTNMYVYNPANFSVNHAKSSELSTRAVNDSDGLQINTTYLKEADAGKVTLRATRNSNGNWSITGLTVGKPLYITHSGGRSCHIKVLSGTNDFVGHAYSIGAVYYYLVVLNSSGAFIYIPTSSTVTFDITDASDDGDILRAYQ